MKTKSAINQMIAWLEERQEIQGAAKMKTKSAINQMIAWLEERIECEITTGWVLTYQKCLDHARLLAQQPEESGLVEEIQMRLDNERLTSYHFQSKLIINVLEELLSRHKESKPIDNKGNDKGLVEQIEKLLHEPCLAIDAWRKVERIKTVIAKFKEK